MKSPELFLGLQLGLSIDDLNLNFKAKISSFGMRHEVLE